MKEITTKMYYKLYDGIHYNIEVRVHHSIHQQANKYVPMVNIMRVLRILVTF